ncbi:MAG: hypothetical protein ACE5FV_03985 [Woeseia sp.]
MRATATTVIAVLGSVLWSPAFTHPATERYIPIGKSPGVSNVKSYIGAIRSVRRSERGFVMVVEDTGRRIEVTEDTKIYLDKGPGHANTTGTEEDCQAGRTVEVYLREDGTAYWVKIRVR